MHKEESRRIKKPKLGYFSNSSIQSSHIYIMHNKIFESKLIYKLNSLARSRSSQKETRKWEL